MNLLKYSVAFLLAISLFAFKGEDVERKNNVLFDVLIQGLERNHYSEITIDDEFSNRVFGLYIERMDYGKRFFTKSDIEKLNYFKDKVDDELRNHTHLLFDKSVEIFNERVNFVEGKYAEILSSPFDFNKNDYIIVDPDKREFVKDTTDLIAAWTNMLKYQTLTRLEDMVEDQDNALEKSDTVIVKKFAELEEEARKKVLKANHDYFKRLEQLDYDDHLSLYINAITNAIDPHTSFFPPQDNENFEISMSGQFEGIGATLSSKDGYITVTNIVPGSASSRQGELEAEDVILKVAQGEEEPVDIVDMKLEYAVKLIRGPKGTEVRLTVKKIDGSVSVIPIIRDVVILEETYAKSIIINTKNKIGYIKLPKFYFDFDKEGGRNCYTDMSIEVEKLKSEKVDGILIDLRDNGGGSLQDVVKIAGLFIEEGPVVQVKARGRDPYIFKDEDKQTQYDGPLVIMVNSFSASASEILAAALQDYDRAIIIGSESTYGKGTVQKVLDFDQVLPPALNDLKPLGAVKVTMQKFYRIDGGTTQLKGVLPDIVLPDNFALIEVGEKEQDYPLAYDRIKAVDYIKFYNKWSPVKDKLAKNSSARVNSNDAFKLVKENAERLKEQKDHSIVSLNFDEYSNYSKSLQKAGEEYRSRLKMDTGLEIANLLEDQKSLESDTVKMQKAEAWSSSLKKDIFLYETVMVMNDLIKEIK